jgi:hypothetical protein
MSSAQPDNIFWKKFEETLFRWSISTTDGKCEQMMVPLESAPQELSNEWSCQYVLTILIFGAISLSCFW